MDERCRRYLRQCGVWIVALAGHALLLLLLARVVAPPERQRFEPSGQPILLMLDLSRPVADAAAPVDVPRGTRIAPTRSVERSRIEDTPAPETAITQPATDPAAPIDWANEARITARSATAVSGDPKTRDFDAPVKPARTRCEKRATSFEWNPEPKKAGFAGILPYVRLGNCIVGLGFFGCPIGEPLAPNSHLFDDMKNPDRATSSVPDVDRCD